MAFALVSLTIIAPPPRSIPHFQSLVGVALVGAAGSPAECLCHGRRPLISRSIVQLSGRRQGQQPWSQALHIPHGITPRLYSADLAQQGHACQERHEADLLTPGGVRWKGSTWPILSRSSRPYD